jgi:hypothetical protein
VIEVQAGVVPNLNDDLLLLIALITTGYGYRHGRMIAQGKGHIARHLVVPAIELLFQLHTRQDCPFHEQDAHSYPSRIGVV